MEKVIYIDPELPLKNQVALLNRNLMLLQGAWESQNADKLELDSIYSILEMSRKWKREQGIGNTSGTYTGWSHLKAEAGYSIWKYTKSDFVHNIDNKLFLDGKSLTYAGQVATESDTSFDSVQTYNGSAYIDRTAEAGSESGTAFPLLADANDYVYIGHASQFSGMDLELSVLGSGHTIVIEYSKGSGTWGTINAVDITDNTQGFVYSGNQSFIIPGDWLPDTVNGVTTKYWIRIKTTTVPTIIATAFFLKPTNNVANLLSLSSNQSREKQWSWCSLGTSIYVTIVNFGNPLYEGDYYITSASSTANKENFFVYNHQFTSDYQDLNYTGSWPGLPTPPTDIYISAIGDDADDGLYTSTPKLTLAAALALIPNPAASSCVIHIASGTHAWSLVNSSRAYINKVFVNSSYLLVKGYINSTPNQFTDVESYSGISDGVSNQSLFPINTTPTEDYTYMSVAGTPWSVNAYAGCFLRLTGGIGYISGAGILDYYYNWYLITSNTSSRLTIQGRFRSTTPDATTTFKIYDPSNAPILSGTGATYGTRFSNADSITCQFLNVANPDTGLAEVITSVDSRDITFLLCRLAGGNSVLNTSKVTFYACDMPVPATKNSGLTCVNYNQIVLQGTYLYGYRGHGILISTGSLEVVNSWIKTDTTTGSTDGFMADGIWADVMASVVLDQSRVEGMNSTSFDSAAIMIETGSVILIRANCHIKGRVASSSTYGILVGRNGILNAGNGPVLVQDNFIGTKAATGALWGEDTSIITYSGNTINTSVDPSAVTPTSGMTDIVPRLFDPSRFCHVWDDFVSGGLTTLTIGSLGWSLGVGATATLTNIADETNHPGIRRLSTGTTSASGVLLTVGLSGSLGTLISGFFDILFWCRLNTNDANTLVRIGMQSNAGANPPNDGIYFEKLVADTSWYGVTRSSSSQTRTAAVASCSTNFAKFRIRRVDSNTIGFTINDGTEVFATLTIPTVTLVSEVYIINSTTADKTLDIDYYDMLISGLSR